MIAHDVGRAVIGARRARGMGPCYDRIYCLIADVIRPAQFSDLFSRVRELL
jgi:hypothetical protein